MAVGYLNGHIFCAGGVGDGSDTFEYWQPNLNAPVDPNTIVVTNLGEKPRVGAAGAIWGNVFYICGGAFTPSSCEAWDESNLKQLNPFSMTVAKNFPAMTAINGALFIIGGQIDAIEKIDLTDGFYTSTIITANIAVPQLQVEIRYMAITTLSFAPDHFLLCGGTLFLSNSVIDSCYIFDTVNEKWEFYLGMHQREGISLVENAGLIYIIGGLDFSTYNHDHNIQLYYDDGSLFPCYVGAIALSRTASYAGAVILVAPPPRPFLPPTCTTLPTVTPSTTHLFLIHGRGSEVISEIGFVSYLYAIDTTALTSTLVYIQYHLSERYWNMAVGYLNGHIFCAGGNVAATTFEYWQPSLIDAVDPSTISVTSLETARIAAAGAVWDNVFYICGGITSAAIPLSSCEAWDGTLKQVDSFSMAGSKRYPVMTAINGALYIIGGQMNAIEKIDLINGGYKSTIIDANIEVPQLRNEYVENIAITKLSFAAHHFLLCGGEFSSGDDIDSCYIFDTINERWHFYLGQMQQRDGISFAENNGFIYIIGGVDWSDLPPRPDSKMQLYYDDGSLYPCYVGEIDLGQTTSHAAAVIL